ncbi:hypothetical protein TRFO_16012 [Tritrichomonas foetus]|uniref:Leucine Rich Repeat family protein n=1 Tax=Tritrichomonas foetus TaxID=1144522 RepID=A0A1J4KVL8_9EUKA|nr:hypothetical protein TRFO_16012 [Tritrichomonas foetus]|eukprot:OHT13788.1 hypothetical protein TRFO_16012 [Tritrichomonas foetus]
MRTASPKSKFQAPNWLQRRLVIVKRTGNLQLINEQNVDLKLLSSPEYISSLTVMKTLDITRTNVKSLEDLQKPFPKLATFIADKTGISDLKNFRMLSNVRAFSLKQTPVSKIPHYKLSLLLCMGSENKISSIDGQVVTKKLKAMAEEYPQPIASDLVNNGWMAEYPCPDETTLFSLCEKFNVMHDTGIYNMPSPKNDVSNIPDDDDDFDNIDEMDFEDLISQLHQKHEEMLLKGQAIFGLISEDTNAYLSGKISSIFRSHGLPIEANSDQNILDAVNILCQTVAKSRSASILSEPSSSVE